MGYEPVDGSSMNALTENSTDYKYDPMYNGISLDLINEKPGGVSSEVDFGENALFKLVSFHAPILIAGSVTSDPNFSTLSDAAYAELEIVSHLSRDQQVRVGTLRRRTSRHAHLYQFYVANPDAGMHFRTRSTISAADLKPVWLKWLDKRTMLQLSPRLVSSDTAYDTKTIHQSSMPKDFALEGGSGTVSDVVKSRTIYARNDLPLVPMAHVRPVRLQ